MRHHLPRISPKFFEANPFSVTIQLITSLAITAAYSSTNRVENPKSHFTTYIPMPTRAARNGSLRNRQCSILGRNFAMSEQFPYQINLDVKYGPLELVDVQKLVDACQDEWYNQTLCQVNDSVVRLGIMQGEFHWHKHDNDDEFFYVIEGRFVIDLEDRSVELTPKQGFTVPKGVMHRTRAPERSVILMIENAGIIPTGD
jgi:hypothetical protein